MPICPRCSEEIDRLEEMQISFQFIHLDEQGKPVYGKEDDYSKDWSQYFCPKCGTTLASTEEEAIRVLKAVAIKN